MAMLYKIARFLEPVTAKIGLRFDAVAVVRKNCIDVFVAELSPEKFAAEKRPVAHDDFAVWPFALCVKLERVIRRVFASLCFFQRFRFAAEMRDEERVFVLEIVQILQN